MQAVVWLMWLENNLIDYNSSKTVFCFQADERDQFCTQAFISAATDILLVCGLGVRKYKP